MPCRSRPKPISPAWLTRKARKIGVSTYTDSLTPRRLSRISPATTPSSAGSLNACVAAGRNEKIASQPAATEIETVST